jgi:hypothetical protein
VINEVHPETGLKINDGFEKVRAQEWAANYERERGVIRCEQRLLNPADREKNMPRNMWVEFRKNELEFLRAEKIMAENASEIPENPKNAEWKILKEFQQAERKEFYADGKIEFSELRKSISREVREEFREKWADYYKAVKNGTDGDREILASRKAELIAEQKSILGPRRDEACNLLRQSRDERYRGLLDQQREDRADLRWRQDAGLDNAPYFSDLGEKRNAAREVALGFREAGREVTSHHAPDRSEMGGNNESQRHEPAFTAGRNGGDGFRVRVFSVGAFLDSLFTGLTNGFSPPPSQPEPDTFRAAAEEAAKQKTPVEYRGFDDDRKEREKSLYGRE